MEITIKNLYNRWFEVEPYVSKELKDAYESIRHSIDFVENVDNIEPCDGETLKDILEREEKRKRMIDIHLKLVAEYIEELNKEVFDKLPKENLDSLDGILNVRKRLLRLKKYCEDNKIHYGCELAKLCNDDNIFYELLLNVVDSDECCNNDDMSAELEFISNATTDEIVDKFFEDDNNEYGLDVLIHFRDEENLTNEMLIILGKYAAEYMKDYNDIQKLNVNPFLESLIKNLLSR
ncbi:MAG: hypothetical protein II937_01465 [Bacteroidales bacterium]|nr:hypothetical protein [Bacteroidales bacterium]